MYTRPADNLTGVSLEQGWQVVEKIKPAPSATGGHFSVGYLARHNSGREGFLKALDFSAAFQEANSALKLQAMLESYNFECALLEKCANRRLRRVAIPLSKGEVLPPTSMNPTEKVYYIIFEKAEGDIRKFHDAMISLDTAWCLRSLHHTASGIRQLHSAHVAHQDLKPSNVLFFNINGSKISDLGRSTDDEIPSTNDRLQIPCDMSYAPPELFYHVRCHSDFRFRKAIDLYLLGSLVFFHFLHVSALHMLRHNINRLNLTMSGTFESDLPYLQQAFSDSLQTLRQAVTPLLGSSTDLLISVVRELCNPDPIKRGNARRPSSSGQYGVERYESQFDLLAKRAELNFP